MLDFDDGFVPEFGSSIISRSGFGRSCDLPGVILHPPCVTCGFAALFRVRIPAHSMLWQPFPVRFSGPPGGRGRFDIRLGAPGDS